MNKLLDRISIPRQLPHGGLMTSSKTTVYYSQQELPLSSDTRSVFLAGPTPRSEDVPSWRPDMIEVIRNSGVEVDIFVPENKDKVYGNYNHQIEWEQAAILKADAVLFWIPRDLGVLPGFTTNVEFGMEITQQPWFVFLGYPEGTPKIQYLAWTYKERTIRVPTHTMEDTWEQVLLQWKLR